MSCTSSGQRVTRICSGALFRRNTRRNGEAHPHGSRSLPRQQVAAQAAQASAPELSVPLEGHEVWLLELLSTFVPRNTRATDIALAS